MSATKETASKVRLMPTVSLVVASMVGTGVFTSLGYQVRDVSSAPAILLLWSLGGLLALCGAFSYAELVAAIPRSGGEYRFLGVLYHPSLGWAAGLLSLVIGFAAPAALAALALGSYAHRAVDWLPPRGFAAAALVLVTLGHLRSLNLSQNLIEVLDGVELGSGLKQLNLAKNNASSVSKGRRSQHWTKRYPCRVWRSWTCLTTGLKTSYPSGSLSSSNSTSCG